MSEKKRTLSLIFHNVEEAHLGKDVFLTPYYLGKQLDYEVSIYFPQTETNKKLPAIHRGVKLCPLRFFYTDKSKIKRILKFACKVIGIFFASDALMLFHYYNMRTPYLGVLYKLLHPSGRLYVKMDASLIALKSEDDYNSIFEKVWKNSFHWLFSKLVDCITCETQKSYDFIMTSKSTIYKFRKNLFIMPNAFDDEMLRTVGLQPKLFEEKKNQFLTVGRIGSPEKNNEMLLRALSQVDMKDWTMQIVGPYDGEFANNIRKFFEDNPEKRDNVVFTGNISDKKHLWEMYNSSKVFILTSTTEGYPLVFVESNVFRNYILSTDVGSFQDVTQNKKYGDSVLQDDDKTLASKMQAIIDGEKNVNVYPSDYKGLMWSEVIRPVAEKLQ